jgi:hypothetical protein
MQFVSSNIDIFYNNPAFAETVIERNQGYIKDNLTLVIIKLN